MNSIELMKGLMRLVEVKENQIPATMVEIAAVISGCSRTCFIQKKGNDFVICSGVPGKEHGIGMAVEGYGKNFLKQVLNDGKMTVISRPLTDPKVFYLRELIKEKGISAIIFLPMCFEDIEIGILTVDVIGNQKPNDYCLLKDFAHFCADLIGQKLRNKKDQEAILNRAKQQEQLSAIGAQVAEISHVFGNRLTTLIGNIDILASDIEDLELPEAVKKRLSEIAEKSLNAALQFREYFDDIRMYSADVKLKSEKVRVNDFVNEIISGFNFEMEFEYQTDRHLDDISVCFDKMRIEDAIHGIIGNAKDAGASRVVIKTALQSKNGTVHIFIGNNGEPIRKTVEPDDQKSIFSPFYTTKEKGTGLGLSIAKKNILAHGGDITCRSEEKSNGLKHRGIVTWFEISLPLNR